MQELKLKYSVKILPNGSQCLSANTGLMEILDKDSNVYELDYESEYISIDDNNNHLIDKKREIDIDDIMCKNSITNLRHCPISYENNLDKLCNMIHITAH